MDASIVQPPGHAAVARPAAPMRSLEDRRIARAAQEFEAVMIAEFLKPVLDQVGTPSIVGGGSQGEATFRGLLREEIAKSIAASGGFGLAEQVRAELLKLQAAESGAGVAGF